ncbi:hypothetical protein WA158_002895 [Blastocystis sp. Blastoise]
MGNVLDCGTSQPSTVEDMQDTTVTANIPGKFIIQQSIPFCDSLFWQLQRMFYEDNNVKAFATSEVPSFVTSNAFVANAYADLILKYLLDWYENPECNKTQPVYILEAGAGHGKLGYLILKRLMELKEFWPTQVKHPFIYILSDFTPATVKWWNNIGYFDEYKKEGIIDFAVFDCENDNSIHLELSGITYSRGEIKNPLYIIANYLFDSLKQDVFLFENNNVYRGMLTLSSNQNETIPVKSDVIPRLQYTWSYQPVPNSEYIYTNEDLNSIIRYYKKNVKSAIVPIPTGSVLFLKNMSDITDNKLIILCGDSGNTSISEFTKKDIYISVNGAFSLSVNFHAIDLCMKNRGGEIFTSPYIDGFRTCIYTYGVNSSLLKRFKWSIQRHLSTFTPDAFFSLQKSIKDESTPSGRTILSLLRLSGYEGDIFIKYKQILIDKGLIGSVCSNEDLLRDIQKILDSYYPLQKTKDVCFEVGRMYMGLKEYDKAIRSFKLSNKYCNEHHISFYIYILSMCYEHLHLYLDAKDAFEKSLELKPTYRESKIMLAKLAPLLDHDSLEHNN